MADKASHEFEGVDSTEAQRNRIEKTVRYGGDDVGLGKAEARMVAFGPKLSSGEASANNNFGHFDVRTEKRSSSKNRTEQPFGTEQGQQKSF